MEEDEEECDCFVVPVLAELDDLPSTDSDWEGLSSFKPKNTALATIVVWPMLMWNFVLVLQAALKKRTFFTKQSTFDRRETEPV